MGQRKLFILFRLSQVLWAIVIAVFSGVHVTRSVVICVMFCRSLFVLFVIILSLVSSFFKLNPGSLVWIIN